jgi:hypothetical protein
LPCKAAATICSRLICGLRPGCGRALIVGTVASVDRSVNSNQWLLTNGY